MIEKYSTKILYYLFYSTWDINNSSFCYTNHFRICYLPVSHMVEISVVPNSHGGTVPSDLMFVTMDLSVTTFPQFIGAKRVSIIE